MPSQSISEDDASEGLAPVAFFAFNRPDHTRQALESLAASPGASETTLYFFVDGPRFPDEAALVERVARLGEAATGFRRVVLRRRTHNLGLFASITGGVSEVLDRYPSAIVVEDDIVASEPFLRYMNDALSKFRDCPQVGSIHAYSPAIDGLPDYFLAGGDCWGWATWKDRWRLFDGDASRLISRLFATGRVEEFCRVQGYRSLLMLAQRALGQSASWALPWHASLFLENRITLHPGTSFVRNIGMDGSGEHSATTAAFDTPIKSSYDGLPELELRPNPDAASALSKYYDCVDGAGKIAFARRHVLKFYSLLLAWYVAGKSRFSRKRKQ